MNRYFDPPKEKKKKKVSLEGGSAIHFVAPPVFMLLTYYAY